MLRLFIAGLVVFGQDHLPTVEPVWDLRSNRETLRVGRPWGCFIASDTWSRVCETWRIVSIDSRESTSTDLDYLDFGVQLAGVYQPSAVPEPRSLVIGAIILLGGSWLDETTRINPLMLAGQRSIKALTNRSGFRKVTP